MSYLACCFYLPTVKIWLGSFKDQFKCAYFINSHCKHEQLNQFEQNPLQCFGLQITLFMKPSPIKQGALLASGTDKCGGIDDVDWGKYPKF